MLLVVLNDSYRLSRRFEYRRSGKKLECWPIAGGRIR